MRHYMQRRSQLLKSSESIEIQISEWRFCSGEFKEFDVDASIPGKSFASTCPSLEEVAKRVLYRVATSQVGCPTYDILLDRGPQP